CLVACAAKKQECAAPAHQLYVSPLFRKAVEYARRHAERFFILSALHGLVEPTAVIAPYNTTLNKMPKAERRAWALLVVEQLCARTRAGDTIIFLAGLRYREGVADVLQARGYHIIVPLAGLGIGQQMQALNRMLTDESVKPS